MARWRLLLVLSLAAARRVNGVASRRAAACAAVCSAPAARTRVLSERQPHRCRLRLWRGRKSYRHVAWRAHASPSICDRSSQARSTRASPRGACGPYGISMSMLCVCDVCMCVRVCAYMSTRGDGARRGRDRRGRAARAAEASHARPHGRIVPPRARARLVRACLRGGGGGGGGGGRRRLSNARQRQRQARSAAPTPPSHPALCYRRPASCARRKSRSMGTSPSQRWRTYSLAKSAEQPSEGRRRSRR